jgi:hypothetical protein
MKLQELFEGLFESRKNPLSNPKIPAYVELKKYKDNPNIFIRFIKHIEQSGENASSDAVQHYPEKETHVKQYRAKMNYTYNFDTPMGVYAYHLPTFWKEKHLDELTYWGGFATKYPEIVIFEWTGKGKFINMDQYTENDWASDRIKLVKIARENYKKKQGTSSNDTSIEELIDTAVSRSNITGAIGKLWAATRYFSFGSAKNWMLIFKKMGYIGFNDTGNGAYKQFEYTQAVFFDNDALKIIKHIDNIIPLNYATVLSDFKIMFDKEFTNYINNFKVQSWENNAYYALYDGLFKHRKLKDMFADIMQRYGKNKNKIIKDKSDELKTIMTPIITKSISSFSKKHNIEYDKIIDDLTRNIWSVTGLSENHHDL